MKTKLKFLVIGVLLCLITINVVSVIRCEMLTHKHYAEFCDAYKENTMLGEIDFFKVLEYEPFSYARVYYVSEGKSGGNILIFKYDNGSWKEISWNTIWSKTGSADNVVYPYWWHGISFAFTCD